MKARRQGIMSLPLLPVHVPETEVVDDEAERALFEELLEKIDLKKELKRLAFGDLFVEVSRSFSSVTR